MTDTSYVLVTIWIAALDQANHEQGEQGADDGVNDDAGGHGFAFPVFVILVIVFPSNVYRGIPLMREFMMVLRLDGLGWVMSDTRQAKCDRPEDYEPNKRDSYVPCVAELAYIWVLNLIERANVQRSDHHEER
jgi:hypothetical protein